MKKIVIISIVIAPVIFTLLFAYETYQNNRKSKNIEYFIDNPQLDGKKLPGDSMTEKAIENAANGKQRMNEQDLPANNKPKANDIQGGVILEGSANQELKVK